MKDIVVDGPFFEDFSRGETLQVAPSVTITDGHSMVHQMLFGDRLQLPIDHPLCAEVTGSKKPLANPAMVISIAIGQTTYATQNVMGNLFYRGLVMKKPVFIGDTLTTSTKVVALRQNRLKAGKRESGLVVLEIRVQNQRAEEILHFWRCPMVPCREAGVVTGHSDSLDVFPADISLEVLEDAVPADWDIELFRQKQGGILFDEVEEATRYKIAARDTVTSAPELTRLTLNLAKAHTDAGASVYGKRLVYGGHTISIAAAHILRALPNIMTLLAWQHCDHLAPVFENDILRSEVIVKKKTPLKGGGGLLDLNVKVWAERGDEAPEKGKEVPVLDWGLVALMP